MGALSSKYVFLNKENLKGLNPEEMHHVGVNESKGSTQLCIDRKDRHNNGD